MAAPIIFFSLAGMCLFSGGFAGGLAWAVRQPGELLDRQAVGFSGVCVAAGAVCFIAGALA